MAFTIVQTVTNKTATTGEVTQVTNKTGLPQASVTNKVNNGQLSRWTDKGVVAFKDGMPIGLLLSFTYKL